MITRGRAIGAAVLSALLVSGVFLAQGYAQPSADIATGDRLAERQPIESMTDTESMPTETPAANPSGCQLVNPGGNPECQDDARSCDGFYDHVVVFEAHQETGAKPYPMSAGEGWSVTSPNMIDGDMWTIKGDLPDHPFDVYYAWTRGSSINWEQDHLRSYWEEFGFINYSAPMRSLPTMFIAWCEGGSGPQFTAALVAAVNSQDYPWERVTFEDVPLALQR